MAWTITAVRDEVPWFEDYVKIALSSTPPPLPPFDQRIGASRAEWFYTEPGIAFIRTTEGNWADRSLAESIVREQLKGHGIRQAKYTFDGKESFGPNEHIASLKLSTWDDIMAKARRLGETGAIQVLRNGFNNIIAQVQGDHGSYEVEISREDPESRAITQWSCTCPWDQYAWQRTRQWKKYEGRPCSHVMAAYWTALKMPLDEEAHPANQEQMFPTPAPTTPPLAPRKPPLGQPAPNQQLQIPFNQTPAEPQPMPGPPGADILPPYPMGPGNVPNPASDPSFKMGPTPANPVDQLGTWSKVATSLSGEWTGGPGKWLGYPNGDYHIWETDEDGNPHHSEIDEDPFAPSAFGEIDPEGAVFDFSNDTLDHSLALAALHPRLYAVDDAGDYRISATEFVNGSIVAIKKEDFGQWEGKGAGPEPARIPAGSVGEVLGQDPVTKMVNVLFMNEATGVNENGPNMPFGITGWFWESELTPRPDIRRPGPAIKRRRER